MPSSYRVDEHSSRGHIAHFKFYFYPFCGMIPNRPDLSGTIRSLPKADMSGISSGRLRNVPAPALMRSVLIKPNTKKFWFLSENRIRSSHRKVPISSFCVDSRKVRRIFPSGSAVPVSFGSPGHAVCTVQRGFPETAPLIPTLSPHRSPASFILSRVSALRKSWLGVAHPQQDCQENNPQQYHCPLEPV